MSVAPSSLFVYFNGCYFVISKDNKKVDNNKSTFKCHHCSPISIVHCQMRLKITFNNNINNNTQYY